MLDKRKRFVVLYTSCRREGTSAEAGKPWKKQIKNRIRKK